MPDDVRSRFAPVAANYATAKFHSSSERLQEVLELARPFAISLPAIRFTSRGIARIIPRDETYAVEEADFVGHVGEVSIGPLDQGLPGKVRLKDVFGNWHSVAARASPESTPLPVGASVLLVDRDARCFIAISAPADLITQQQTSRRA